MANPLNESLNEVRPGRPEQSDSRIAAIREELRLNEVRPGRPEQYHTAIVLDESHKIVSMKSGLEDRNNITIPSPAPRRAMLSQ